MHVPETGRGQFAVVLEPRCGAGRPVLPAVSAPLASQRSCQVLPGWASSQSSRQGQAPAVGVVGVRRQAVNDGELELASTKPRRRSNGVSGQPRATGTRWELGQQLSFYLRREGPCGGYVVRRPSAAAVPTSFG